MSAFIRYGIRSLYIFVPQSLNCLMVLNIAIIHGINEQTPLLAPGEADVNCTIFPIETKALIYVIHYFLSEHFLLC